VRARQFLRGLVLVFSGWGCSPAHSAPSLHSALSSAIGTLPWDADSGGWGAFCSASARCDTLLIEPRVARLPEQPPTFFVPAARPLAIDLRKGSPGMEVKGRFIRYADWAPCLSQRLDSGWTRRGVACLAVGLAGAPAAASDTVRLALLVVTPARGLVWPHLRLVADGSKWIVERLWMGEE
jgi:hypothetical protein